MVVSVHLRAPARRLLPPTPPSLMMPLSSFILPILEPTRPLQHTPAGGAVVAGASLDHKMEAWMEDNMAPKRNSQHQIEAVDSFRSLVAVVRLANVFGLMPLSVRDARFRFEWLSFLMVYSLVVVSLMAGFVVVRIVALLAVQDTEEDWVPILTATVFYLLGATGAVLLMRLARNLPDIMTRWSGVEGHLGCVGSSQVKVVACVSVFMLSAAGETTASLFYAIPLNCTTDFWMFLKCYVISGHKYEITLLGYTDAFGVTILVINKYATVVWNFVDVLIASIAIILTRHIRLYNIRLKTGCGWWSAGEWRRGREDHLAFLHLTKALDAALGPLVLHSYVTNLFFILVQLYLGLRLSQSSSKILESSNGFILTLDAAMIMGKKEPNFSLVYIPSCRPSRREDVVARLYLTWSFLHLLARLLLVSFTCSALHESSKQSLVHILTIPTERYGIEVWRLHQQLQDQEVGLSGYGFFLVTKSFILATTGALVTYEVVLLQLNAGPAALSSQP